jgi:hypothetical protein
MIVRAGSPFSCCSAQREMIHPAIRRVSRPVRCADEPTASDIAWWARHLARIKLGPSVTRSRRTDLGEEPGGRGLDVHVYDPGWRMTGAASAVLSHGFLRSLYSLYRV